MKTILLILLAALMMTISLSSCLVEEPGYYRHHERHYDRDDHREHHEYHNEHGDDPRR
jgi:hypothetical protein